MTEVKDRNVSIYDLNIPIVLDHLKKAAGELIQKKSLTPFARNSAKTQWNLAIFQVANKGVTYDNSETVTGHVSTSE